MLRFYLIRHADAYDENGMQIESSKLNNYGKIQALQLSRRLKDNKFDAMYCSRVQRAMDTCEIVNEVHKMSVIYSSKFNEVGSNDWPQPGVISSPQVIDSYKQTVVHINRIFNELIKHSKHIGHQEVIVFTHGNWIRVLLSKILSHGSVHTFSHFVIHNSSLNIIDIDDNNYPHIITVSDAAHTQLFKSII